MNEWTAFSEKWPEADDFSLAYGGSCVECCAPASKMRKFMDAGELLSHKYDLKGVYWRRATPFPVRPQ